MSGAAIAAVIVLLVLVAVGVWYFLFRDGKKSTDKKSSSGCAKARGVDAWDRDCKYVLACDVDTGYVVSKNRDKCECNASLGFKDNGTSCVCDTSKNLKTASPGNCLCADGYTGTPPNCSK